jgi:hypothetical protein
MNRHWIAPLLLLCALSVSAASPVTPQRVRVSSGVMQALLVKKVPPQYPQDAKDQHIEGVVVLKAVINKEGNVSKSRARQRTSHARARRNRGGQTVEVPALPSERRASRSGNRCERELHARALALPGFISSCPASSSCRAQWTQWALALRSGHSSPRSATCPRWPAAG